jgi:gas vesicle protein
MKKLWMMLPLVGLLAACDTQEQRMITGTATGAAIGAAVSSPEDRAKGAVIGGTVGLIAGTLIGRDTTGRCLYERRDGSRYYANC